MLGIALKHSTLKLAYIHILLRMLAADTLLLERAADLATTMEEVHSTMPIMMPVAIAPRTRSGARHTLTQPPCYYCRLTFVKCKVRGVGRACHERAEERHERAEEWLRAQ